MEVKGRKRRRQEEKDTYYLLSLLREPRFTCECNTYIKNIGHGSRANLQKDQGQEWVEG